MKSRKLSIIRNFAILIILVLAGCASAPVPVTQRVEVPVAVPCVAAGAVPAKPFYHFDKLPTTASDGEKVIALANDWLVGRKYEEKLEALLLGCDNYRGG